MLTKTSGGKIEEFNMISTISYKFKSVKSYFYRLNSVMAVLDLLQNLTTELLVKC